LYNIKRNKYKYLNFKMKTLNSLSDIPIRRNIKFEVFK